MIMKSSENSDKGLELFDADGEHGGEYFPLRFPEEITVEDIRQLIDIPEEVARKYLKLSAKNLTAGPLWCKKGEIYEFSKQDRC